MLPLCSSTKVYPKCFRNQSCPHLPCTHASEHGGETRNRRCMLRLSPDKLSIQASCTGPAECAKRLNNFCEFSRQTCLHTTSFKNRRQHLFSIQTVGTFLFSLAEHPNLLLDMLDSKINHSSLGVFWLRGRGGCRPPQTPPLSRHLALCTHYLATDMLLRRLQLC